jgi:hypothetical protein
LTAEDAPYCKHDDDSNERFSYHGPIVKPDASCYELVTHAYAHAKLGKQGAELAEGAFRRYEQNNQPGQYASRYIMKEVLKAVVGAQEFQKAIDLLQLMEDRFQETKDVELAPDSRMYNVVTSGLANINVKDKKYAAVTSRQILNNMRSIFISGDNPLAMPNRYTYTHFMQCEAKVGKGHGTFQRLEDLYRQLEADYSSMDRFDVLKPDALSALPLFQVAVNSKSNTYVIHRAFDVFDELQQRYLNIGDPAYAPVEKMYKYLYTSVGRLRHGQAVEFNDRVNQCIDLMKQNFLDASIYTITTGTLVQYFLFISFGITKHGY